MDDGTVLRQLPYGRRFESGVHVPQGDFLMPSRQHFTRRAIMQLAAVGGLTALIPRSLRGTSHGLHWQVHPTPRPDYIAKVLTADKLGGDKELIALFDGVRKIPQIVDGIGCTCGCAEQEGYYSLLTCYETDDAMSKWCPICIGLGQLVVRLHGRGRSLEQIREAVDARN
jgi:hypothetical protein